METVKNQMDAGYANEADAAAPSAVDKQAKPPAGENENRMGDAMDVDLPASSSAILCEKVDYVEKETVADDGSTAGESSLHVAMVPVIQSSAKVGANRKRSLEQDENKEDSNGIANASPGESPSKRQRLDQPAEAPDASTVAELERASDLTLSTASLTSTTSEGDRTSSDRTGPVLKRAISSPASRKKVARETVKSLSILSFFKPK